jgi:zinc and cadmium transporter
VLQVIFFSMVGGVLSLSLAVFMLKGSNNPTNIIKLGTPFAAGALLAAAFADLLKEALHLEKSNQDKILLAVLAGIMLFYFLEKFIHWFHHHSHNDHEHAEDKASSTLIILGDTIHNALDGVAIAAAFLVSPSAGIVTTIAVAAHELPQEIGDFALLFKRGMAKSKIIKVNILSSLATTITAIIVYALGSAEAIPLSYILAITAGFFIYIAASDIMPDLHKDTSKVVDIQSLMLILGLLTVLLISPIAHSFIEEGESDHETGQHSEKETSHSDEQD